MNTHLLQTQLEDYAAAAPYPLHMPGHKRRVNPAPGLPAAWDVTEVPGVDDLHEAQGILADAMNRAAALWGAQRSWFFGQRFHRRHSGRHPGRRADPAGAAHRLRPQLP